MSTCPVCADVHTVLRGADQRMCPHCGQEYERAVYQTLGSGIAGRPAEAGGLNSHEHLTLAERIEHVADAVRALRQPPSEGSGWGVEGQFNALINMAALNLGLARRLSGHDDLLVKQQRSPLA